MGGITRGGQILQRVIASHYKETGSVRMTLRQGAPQSRSGKGSLGGASGGSNLLVIEFPGRLQQVSRMTQLRIEGGGLIVGDHILKINEGEESSTHAGELYGMPSALLGNKLMLLKKDDTIEIDQLDFKGKVHSRSNIDHEKHVYAHQIKVVL